MGTRASVQVLPLFDILDSTCHLAGIQNGHGQVPALVGTKLWDTPCMFRIPSFPQRERYRLRSCFGCLELCLSSPRVLICFVLMLQTRLREDELCDPMTRSCQVCIVTLLDLILNHLGTVMTLEIIRCFAPNDAKAGGGLSCWPSSRLPGGHTACMHAKV